MCKRRKKSTPDFWGWSKTPPPFFLNCKIFSFGSWGGNQGPPSSQRLTDRPHICGIRFSRSKIVTFFWIFNRNAVGEKFCSKELKRRKEKDESQKNKVRFLPPLFPSTFSPSCRCVHSNIWPVWKPSCPISICFSRMVQVGSAQ